jgi:hypothetical protein
LKKPTSFIPRVKHVKVLKIFTFPYLNQRKLKLFLILRNINESKVFGSLSTIVRKVVKSASSEKLVQFMSHFVTFRSISIYVTFRHISSHFVQFQFMSHFVTFRSISIYVTFRHISFNFNLCHISWPNQFIFESPASCSIATNLVVVIAAQKLSSDNSTYFKIKVNIY